MKGSLVGQVLFLDICLKTSEKCLHLNLPNIFCYFSYTQCTCLKYSSLPDLLKQLSPTPIGKETF